MSTKTTSELLDDCLRIDVDAEADRIAGFIRETVTRTLRKKGVIVAVSGGIDSSTTAALCVRALGPERVFALLLPERDSSDDSTHYGRMLVEHLGIKSVLTDISPTLEAMGCYRYRDEAISEVFSDYTAACRSKIVLQVSSGESSQVNLFSVVVQWPDGIQKKARLPLRNYLQLVAATNMKQRTRKSLEYFHADRLNYAVVGTPNFLEYDQGFFVKLGDGAADLKPIAHLYKTQVYAMARALGLPSELCERQPTTDTYSLEQTQEEFYFQLPYQKMDLVSFGMDNDVDPQVIADKTGLSL